MVRALLKCWNKSEILRKRTGFTLCLAEYKPIAEEG